MVAMGSPWGQPDKVTASEFIAVDETEEFYGIQLNIRYFRKVGVRADAPLSLTDTDFQNLCFVATESASLLSKILYAFLKK